MFHHSFLVLSCDLQFSVLHRFLSGHGVHMGRAFDQKALPSSGLGAVAYFDRGSTNLVYAISSIRLSLSYNINIDHQT
jgi:hypothetical protein